MGVPIPVAYEAILNRLVALGEEINDTHIVGQKDGPERLAWTYVHELLRDEHYKLLEMGDEDENVINWITTVEDELKANTGG